MTPPEPTIRGGADLLGAGLDGLVVLADHEALSALASRADDALDGLLSELHANRQIGRGFGEVSVVPTLGRLPTRWVLVLSLGDRAVCDTTRVYNAFQFAGREARARGLGRLGLDCDRGLLGEGRATAAATGALLANVEPVHSGEHPRPALSELVFDVPVDEAGALWSTIVADATNRARLWSSLPGNQLTPAMLGQRATEIFAGLPVAVEVHDAERLRELGAGGVLAVGGGSANPPCMITARYDGAGPAGTVLGLVGKGITFDAGGISLKDPLGMELMKFDMSGAAAVLNAVAAIARLGTRLNVLSVVAAAENMPSGRATKPGDVYTALDGTGVEVINTDAEGRLVLGDALALARRLGATHLVDVATLTGAMVITLGHVATGMTSNDDELARLVAEAGERAGERMWRLPLYPEYDFCLKSDVADIKNWAGRENGSLAAAVFLRHFVGDVPWAHLDIAGTAWNSQADLAQVPPGASGTPTRALVALAEAMATSGNNSSVTVGS